VKLRIAELRKVLDTLFEEVLRANGPDVELGHDLYWDILFEHWYEVELVLERIELGESSFLVLGSLYDDVARVAALAREDRPVMQYDLKAVASVVRYLGELPWALGRKTRLRAGAAHDPPELSPFELGRRVGSAEARRITLLEIGRLVAPEAVARLQGITDPVLLETEVMQLLPSRSA
jgi:hypothetical protein